MRQRHTVVSLSIGLGIFVAGLNGAVPTAASDPAPGGWGPAVDVSRSPADVFDLELAGAPDGSALSAWVRWGGARPRVMTAGRGDDGTWGAPALLPGSLGAGEVEVAFDGRGGAVAVWTRGREVRAARRTTSGEWSAPERLHRTAAGRRGTRPGYLQLAVNHRGRAVVAWETVDDDRDGVYARSRVQAVVGTAAGAWTRARRLSTRGVEGIRPEVALDRAGRATVVWADLLDRRWRVMAASRAVRETWSDARVLSRRREQAGPPQVTGLPGGDLAVAWGFVARGSTGIRVRRWSRTTGWSRAVTSDWAVGRRGGGWTDVAMAGDGKVTVVWTGGAGAVWAADLDASDAWTRARVAPPGSVFYGLEVVVNQKGDTVVGWTSVDNGHHPVQAAYRSHAGSWGEPVDISAARGDSWGPASVLEGDGDAVAVWSRGTDAEFSSLVRSRAYSAH